MLRLALLSLVAFSAPIAAKPATDWSKTVRVTADGGYVMGNPSARVKLLEFGSLTCPHCAKFDAEGASPLIASYVRGGRVSWEFRSFLLNAIDVPATLAATCAGPARFFPVMRAIYAGQPGWVGKIQALPAERMKDIQAMARPQQIRALGEAAGFPALAAAHGVPVAKTKVCLNDQVSATRAVASTRRAADQLKVNGTPTFFVNGETVDTSAGSSAWAAVKSRLDAALLPKR